MEQTARKEAVSAAFAKRGGKIRRETPANGKAFTDEEINELLSYCCPLKIKRPRKLLPKSFKMGLRVRFFKK